MKPATTLITILTLFAGIYYYTTLKPQTPNPNSPNQTTTTSVEETNTSNTPLSTSDPAPSQIALFSNSKYGFSFNYRIKPAGHSVIENTEAQNAEQKELFGVSLIRAETYNEMERNKNNGEIYYDGPRSMMVSVFDIGSSSIDIMVTI